MSPEDQKVYTFMAGRYPDLQRTWAEHREYYRSQARKAHDRAAPDTAIAAQLAELHALAVAMETATQTIRRVCYRMAMQTKRANGEPHQAV